MMLRTAARSISRPVLERLHRDQFAARVLAVFEQACDLVASDDVVALVTSRVGDGPLNIVVDGEAGLFAGVVPGSPVILEQEQLFVDGLTVHLRGARLWEPCPDWDTLRVQGTTIESRLLHLRALCLRYAPPGSLLMLLGAPMHDDGMNGTFLRTARQAAEVLREGWQGNKTQWRQGVNGLTGLGNGLTPAGDDFLVGATLASWLAHPDPGPLCCALAEVAPPRTTTLSAAFLRAAARGECSAPWHALLTALSEGAERKIEAALREILTHGATSGADALAGFLYLMLDAH
jgi:hypothetical protein